MIKLKDINSQKSNSGFTIVELLVVIVIIAILATLSIVAYNGIQKKAGDSAIRSDLSQAAKQLSIIETTDGSFPNNANSIKKSDGTTYQYTYDSNTKSYCLTASNQWAEYHITNTNTIPQDGVCDGHTQSGPAVDGNLIQTITSQNCPTNKIRAVDARDSHTYWVQKLEDGKCWMLTNLAYSGGGSNTYNDIKSITDNTNGSIDNSYPYYYVVPSTTNYTTEPTNPSTSTNGSGQYGYLYNWCGTMGGQATAACSSYADYPTPNTTVSICPYGWKLPAGNGGDFATLNTAVNGGQTNTDSGLRTSWLAQRGGEWAEGFTGQGSSGRYWSSTQQSAGNVYTFYFTSSNSSPTAVFSKNSTHAIRCIAS